MNRIKIVMKTICITCLFLSIIFAVLTADIVSNQDAPKYDRANKRNPFIPIVTNDGQLVNIREDDEKTEMNLEGIIYDKDGQSMAIINGQILRKNDNIGDGKIVEIRKDGVVYIKDGEVFKLDLKREE